MIGDPREGKGYVATFDFIPVLGTSEESPPPPPPLPPGLVGDPREGKGYAAIPPNSGPDKSGVM